MTGWPARSWPVAAAIVCLMAIGPRTVSTATAQAPAGGPPAAPPPATVSIGDIEQARYDEAALKTLLERCRPNACAAEVTAAIEGRLATVARERAQFAAAQTEADYQTYMSSCVACTYRAMAVQVLQNLRTAAAPVGPQPGAAPPIPPVPGAGPAIPPAPGGGPGIPPVPSAAGNKWHAIARVVYRVRGNARVSVGYSGAMSTPLEAEQAAKQRCESSADGHECDVGTAQNSGCLYITTGRTRRGVIETAGASIQDAYDKCVGAGYQCQQPIGGCLQ